jgi:hypothetical protein
MGRADILTRLLVTGRAVLPDAEFDIRWTPGLRGRLHEQRIRRRFLIAVPVIAIGAAIAFALLRS